MTPFNGASYRPEHERGVGAPNGHTGSWQVHVKPGNYPADYHGVYYDRQRMAPFPTKDPRTAPF